MNQLYKALKTIKYNFNCLIWEKKSIKGRYYSKIYNRENQFENITNVKINELNDKNIVDIIVVAFNNVNVIKKQYLLIKKFFKDEYNYTIFDNSSNIEESELIREFCIINNIPYIRLKKSLCTDKTMASENHAIALNYIYKNYVLIRKPKYVAFLDHDIFPIENFCVTNILEVQNIYGYLKEERLKYLWPGFSFFKLSYIIDKKIDFMTNWKFGGDTGASNFKALYKDILREKNLKFANCERIKLNTSDSDPQKNMYSLMDEGKWLHMLNGGNWRNLKEFNDKQVKVFELLDEIYEEGKKY